MPTLLFKPPLLYPCPSLLFLSTKSAPYPRECALLLLTCLPLPRYQLHLVVRLPLELCSAHQLQPSQATATLAPPTWELQTRPFVAPAASQSHLEGSSWVLLLSCTVPFHSRCSINRLTTATQGTTSKLNLIMFPQLF